MQRIKERLETVKGGFSFGSRSILAMAAALAACLCAALLMAQSVGVTAKDTKAKEAADAATKAIGVVGKIGEIKSLVIKGTWSRSKSRRDVGLGMEIRILLPDNFVLISQLDMGGPWYSGVSQGVLIPQRNTNINPIGFDGRVLPPEQIEAFAKKLAITINNDTNNEIDDWSRFLIGTLMKAGSTPVTISSVAEPGIFNLTKNGGALGEIEFDAKTGYPSVIRYKNAGGCVQSAATIDFIRKPTNIETDVKVKTDTAVAVTSDDMCDGEVKFQDRFSINGIMFPRIIVSDKGDQVLGPLELRIEEALINPKLSLKDFERPPR